MEPQATGLEPMLEPLSTRVLLLVEDNPGDVDLVRKLLEAAEGETYQVLHASRMSEALETLQRRTVDVILLDLRLPDAEGLASVKAVREMAGDLPIVVLTGAEDESLALSCIDAGAQDYLCKAEVRALTLRRAIGYAITRLREMQLRSLQGALAAYRTLSSQGSGTSVTAALAGSGAISARYAEVFRRLIHEYQELLELSMDERAWGQETARSRLGTMVTRIGDLGGGPRDLLDLHVTALDQLVTGRNDARARALVIEGRLVALELMGMLVDYYRVGFRRWMPDREDHR